MQVKIALFVEGGREGIFSGKMPPLQKNKNKTKKQETNSLSTSQDSGTLPFNHTVNMF